MALISPSANKAVLLLCLVGPRRINQTFDMFKVSRREGINGTSIVNFLLLCYASKAANKNSM